MTDNDNNEGGTDILAEYAEMRAQFKLIFEKAAGVLQTGLITDAETTSHLVDNMFKAQASIIANDDAAERRRATAPGDIVADRGGFGASYRTSRPDGMR